MVVVRRLPPAFPHREYVDMSRPGSPTLSVVLSALGSRCSADGDSPVIVLACGCDCGPQPHSPFVACSCKVVLTEVESQKWLGGSDIVIICHVVSDEPCQFESQERGRTECSILWRLKSLPEGQAEG